MLVNIVKAEIYVTKKYFLNTIDIKTMLSIKFLHIYLINNQFLEYKLFEIYLLMKNVHQLNKYY